MQNPSPHPTLAPPDFFHITLLFFQTAGSIAHKIFSDFGIMNQFIKLSKPKSGEEKKIFNCHSLVSVRFFECLVLNSFHETALSEEVDVK